MQRFAYDFNRQRHKASVTFTTANRNAQFTPPPARQDKTVLSVSYQAVWIESARQVRSASDCVRRSHCAARHTPTQTRHRTHRRTCLSIHTATPDTSTKTAVSVSCPAWRCELALSNAEPLKNRQHAILTGIRQPASALKVLTKQLMIIWFD